MTILTIGGVQQSADLSDSQIAAAVSAAGSQDEPIVIVRDQEQNHFVQAAPMKGDLFLLEYRDIYGHMAADEPLSADELLAVLSAYVGGDDGWIKDLSWAPVEL